MPAKAMSTGVSLASCCASITFRARTGGVGDAQAVHMLDMLGPWNDERHVLARLHHMRAGIPADGARSDDSYLPTHASPGIAFSRGQHTG